MTKEELPFITYREKPDGTREEINHDDYEVVELTTNYTLQTWSAYLRHKTDPKIPGMTLEGKLPSTELAARYRELIATGEIS